MRAPNGLGFLKEIIRAGRQLGLSDLIAASFPAALGMPIAITGAALPWPYNHVLLSGACTMIVSGGGLLIYRAFKHTESRRRPLL